MLTQPHRNALNDGQRHRHDDTKAEAATFDQGQFYGQPRSQGHQAPFRGAVRPAESDRPAAGSVVKRGQPHTMKVAQGDGLAPIKKVER